MQHTISHNPYFNRWFSAILAQHDLLIEYHSSHNPYFSRWFSAIKQAPINEIYKV